MLVRQQIDFLVSTFLNSFAGAENQATVRFALGKCDRCRSPDSQIRIIYSPKQHKSGYPERNQYLKTMDCQCSGRVCKLVPGSDFLFARVYNF
jgi:hypothetical protein